ncbi:MAG: DUF4149 domain-containing protein [Acidobacteriaceae bacterium]
MLTTLRFFKLLAIVVWLGGIVFFAFVLAPVAFTRLPSPHLAGMVVGGTLSILHTVGLFCGLLFLLATLSTYALARYRKPRIAAEAALVCAMLALTAYSQFSVIPRMEVDRQRVAASGVDIDSASPSNPSRRDFDHLHGLSEKLEGIVLLAGVAVVWLLARREELA